MDILVLSDIHDSEEALDRVRVLASKRKFDALFIAGDISNSGSVEFVKELIAPFENIYAVPGNMDRPPVVGLLKENGISVHNKKRKLGKFEVAGFGGSNQTSRNMPFTFTDQEMGEALGKLEIGRKTILLTHMPPRGCYDLVDGENLGSAAIRKIIEDKMPFMSISGHIHEHEGEQMLGDTIVVSVGAAKNLRAGIIKVEKGEVEVDFINL